MQNKININLIKRLYSIQLIILYRNPNLPNIWSENRHPITCNDISVQLNLLNFQVDLGAVYNRRLI